ncbi:hypothetical protein F4780DRAFT_76064 [Xylariomycetidae sp. FL0641]|nr:hypothetical protein F4780DRAFT_76064 [Xylariomycetidae sp. FL0641]
MYGTTGCLYIILLFVSGVWLSVGIGHAPPATHPVRARPSDSICPVTRLLPPTAPRDSVVEFSKPKIVWFEDSFIISPDLTDQSNATIQIYRLRLYRTP